MWKGMFRSGPKTLDNLLEEVETLSIEKEGVLPPLIWS